MQVFKFGGVSVKDAISIKNVANILKNKVNEPTVVVISAMGKMTNKLEELVNAYFYKSSDSLLIFQEIKDYHFNIINQLFVNKDLLIVDEIENVFLEILWLIEEEPSNSYSFYYDQLVSQGEILSTKII